MNKLQELKAMSALKNQKDPNRPVVKIKGVFHSSRVIQAKFGHAEDAPFVRLNLSHISAHSFCVVPENRRSKNDTDPVITDHVLYCNSLAMGRGADMPHSYRIATFYSSEHAEEALAAIEKSMNSTRKYWVMGVVGVLTWVVLFMPMSNNPNASSASRAQANSNSSLSMPMGARMPASMGQMGQPIGGRPVNPGGLAIPSAPSMGSLGAIGAMDVLQVPGAAGGGSLGSLGAIKTPETAGTLSSGPGALAAPSAQTAQPAQRAAGPEDDPFGLKISPTGTSSTTQR